MSYTLYYSLGSITIPANTINTQTSIYLPGEDYVPYGAPVDQSLLNLLQNFANSTPPPRSIPGQTWFDTNENVLKITTNGGPSATWKKIDEYGLPGGISTSVQFNDGGYLGGEPNFRYDKTTSKLMVSGPIESTSLAVSGGVTAATVAATTGTFTNIGGTLTTAAQPAITSVGTLTSLAVTGGITAATMAATTGTFTNIGGTLTTAAQPAITSVGTLTSLAVSGGVTAATMAATTGTFTNIGGTLTTAAQPAITSVGTLTSLAVSGGVTAATVAATTGTFTNIGGTLTTAAQPAITSVGTLTSLAVTGGITAATMAATTGTFTNLGGTLTTAAQPAITSVGTLTSLAVSGAITTGSINITGGSGLSAPKVITPELTTGATGTSGTITGQWTLGAGSTLQATYADLAERYTGDRDYEAGTVLEFGGEHEVTLATEYTTRVAGVVSTNAAYIMNGDCGGEHVVTLALQGRVPCRVTGTVQKGDMMISAGNGLAKASRLPAVGTVIGKSLENFTGESGIIEVVVGRV